MPIKPVSGKIQSQEINDNLSYLESEIIKKGSGTPKIVVNTPLELKTNYPNGSEENAVVMSNGHIYSWNGSIWLDTGIQYQSTGIANRSITPIKLDLRFDFLPITSFFGKRTIDTSNGNFIPSNDRYTSDYQVFNSQHIVVCEDPSYQISIRFFSSTKEVLYTSSFASNQINLNDISSSFPTAVEYLIYVANTVDKTTIADGLGDYLSSVIYVKTNSYPARMADFEKEKFDTNIALKKMRLAPWLRNFPKANFDRTLLTTDESGYLKIVNDISTTEFHKWLLYYKTDEQREIKSVKGKFYVGTSMTESNRIFIESSDGRVIWFQVATTGEGEVTAYGLNKVDGTVYGPLPSVSGATVPYSYPTAPKLIDLEVRILGKAAFMYIDGMFHRSVDLKQRIGDNINKCGISYRGNISNFSKLVDLEVQYKPEKIMHISIDDVYTLLKDLTTNAANYNSIFDNSTFAFLRDMHNKYGAVFSLYLFYTRTDDTFSMANVTKKYKNEFTENSHWLKFGYHAKDEATYGVNLTDDKMLTSVMDMHSAIKSFAGENSIDMIPRFHFYSVSDTALKKLRLQNLIIGALTADDNRAANSGLSGAPLQIVQNYDSYCDVSNDINYFRSEYRFDGVGEVSIMEDQLNGLYNDINNNEQYILFAHSVLQTPITAAIEWAYKKGNIRFEFPQNII